MKKRLILSIFVIFVSIPIFLLGCGSDNSEEPATEIESTEAEPQEEESEAQELQKKVNDLELELSELKAAKDLIAFIIGEDSTPLSGTRVSIPETGEEIVVGEDGKVYLKNLSVNAISFLAYAQGYLPIDKIIELEDGSNGILLIMERDPFGLLPSENCQEQEVSLYLEDFQDGIAQGWTLIDDSQEGWSIIPDPNNKGNMLLSASEPGQSLAMLNNNSTYNFDNAVWRIRTKLTTNTTASFWWNYTPGTDDNSVYRVLFGNQVSLETKKLQNVLDVTAPSTNVWHTLEISRFQGVFELWIDGKKYISYNDPDPIPAGTIGLMYNWVEDAGEIFFDDISVCELKAPFTSIFESE